MLQGEVSDYPGAFSNATSGLATPADVHVTGRNPALQVGESLRNALSGPTLADIRQTSGASGAATPQSTASAGPAPKSALFYPLKDSSLSILLM